MTKPWISDARQRASKAYRDTHEALRIEVGMAALAKALNAATEAAGKRERKRAKSDEFRMRGEM